MFCWFCDLAPVVSHVGSTGTLGALVSFGLAVNECKIATLLVTVAAAVPLCEADTTLWLLLLGSLLVFSKEERKAAVFGNPDSSLLRDYINPPIVIAHSNRLVS